VQENGRWLLDWCQEIRKASGARAITSNLLGRMWITLVAGLLGLKPFVRGAGKLLLPVRLPTGRVILIADISELMAIDEVFVKGGYDDPYLPGSASTILDLGANAGVASEFFATRYPASRIVAVEADPRVARRARRNLRGRNVTVHGVAVADRSEPIELRRNDRMSWATSAHSATGERFTVPGITLDEIIGEAHVEILKIDIEGSEYAVIARSKRLHQVDLILGEFHPVDGVTADAFFALLSDFELLSRGGNEQAAFAARRRR
jgi:FkbM family methyltransferase